jgi:hypothetical protein
MVASASPSTALHQPNFFSVVFIESLSLPSFVCVFSTKLSSPTRCWRNFASTLDAGNGGCSQNFLACLTANKDYRDEVANFFCVGTLSEVKDSSFGLEVTICPVDICSESI